MKSQKNTPISEAELEVMQVLWDADKPLNIKEVCEGLPDDKWKYNTVGTLLLRMAQKGAVSSEKTGRNIYYSPVLNRDDYTEAQTRKLVSRLYNGSVKALAVSLLKSEAMSEDDIEDIRKMFDL